MSLNTSKLVITPTKRKNPFNVRFVRCELERICFLNNLSVKLKWSHGRRRGVYIHKTRTLNMGPHAWNGVKDTMLHQFAHVLCQQSSVHDLKQDHDYKFRECLWKLVINYYEDPAKYSWYGEHGKVFEFGMNRVRSWRMKHEK